MRYAAAKNNGNATYSELVDSCRHSRLKAALSSHLPLGSTRRVSAPVATAYASQGLSLSDFNGEYLWLACMSVVSLLSIFVTGVITA